MNTQTFPSFKRAIVDTMKNNPRFWLRALPSAVKYVRTVNHYRPIATNHEHHLRDEIGIIAADATEASVAATRARAKALPVLVNS